MKRVVIIGRPNVGKSTLFNRLATSVKSLTLDYMGVTRDFLRDTVEWKDHHFDLIDSGGMIVAKPPDELEKKIQLVIRQLLDRADLVLFVVDGRHEITADDWAIARELHKVGRPVITVVNKLDTPELDAESGEFEMIGFPVVGVSSEHGRHLHVLLDAVTERLPHTPTVTEKPEPLVKVMLLGKPNVGKSSLMNMLLKEERAIVSDVPGTTRQALSESVMYYRESIEVTDAPGVRRKRAVEETLEELMVKRAFDALKKANLVLLLIDGSQKVVVDQEIKLAFYAFQERHKSLILVVNKSDLMTKDDREKIQQQLTKYSHLVKKIPLIFISCKTGEHVGKLMALIKKVSERSQQQFDEALLSKCIEEFNRKPLYVQGERLLLGWARQVGTQPPRLLLGVSDPKKFQPSTFSFIDSLLRKRFDLLGVAVKFLVCRTKIVRISEDDGQG